MPRLIVTGDILPADRQHTLSIGAGSQFRNNGGEDWLSFFETFDQGKDIFFGNLEAPLLPLDAKKEKEAFAGDIKFADWLARAGFDVVSVANNHILEQGATGFQSTITALKSMKIKPIGIKDERYGSNLVSLQKDNIRIGFAAFNDIHDITPNYSYAELNESSVVKAISGLKEEGADLVCLSFHWGNEYIHIPSWQQVQLAHKAIDAGADIIIGHHPHVAQPVEEYKQGIIIYSLGNFIFDMFWAKQVRCGMCVEIELNKDGIAGYKTHLVDIQNDYTPVIVRDDDWLNHLLKENQELMRHLLERGKETFENHYFKKLKSNRFKSRLGMKKQLINQWTMLDKPVKKEILKSIFTKPRS